MKILILGGAGAMAYATIRDLLEFDSQETSQLTIADIYYEKVESLAKELNDDRVSVARCDLTDHASLVNTMKGHDIVLNEAPGKYGLLALNAALEAGAHIIDLGGDARSKLELNDQFEKAGLTAILGLGSSPGITNVAAGYLVGKLDTVETIYMSFAYAELVKAVFFIPFLGAIEEFIHNGRVFRDGKHVELPPQSGQEDELFPEPIGVRRMINIPHPEIDTFPIFFKEKGIKNVSIKAGFTPDFVEKLNFLISIGIINEQPIKVKDQTIVPYDVFNACYAKLPPLKERIDYGCTRVYVKGEKSGEKIEYRAEMVNRPYKTPAGVPLTGVQHRTGHSPAIAARMIKRGQITRRGVFAPEVGVDPEIFFKELSRRELEVAAAERHFM